MVIVLDVEVLSKLTNHFLNFLLVLSVVDDQVEILGQTDDGTHFVVLNKRTNQQGECPIDIIDICEWFIL